MGNKKSRPNKNNNKNSTINSNNIVSNININSYNTIISNNTINYPKLKLDKFFDNVSSIYYCYELIDGRLFLCICGVFFDIYNINQLDKNKKRIRNSSWNLHCF